MKSLQEKNVIVLLSLYFKLKKKDNKQCDESLHCIILRRWIYSKTIDSVCLSETNEHTNTRTKKTII